MLGPDDRSILLDLLRPPVGYSLDRAVGTTFTLDLESALAVPLAFASHRLSASTDPIAVMEAVRSAADRVDLFCQAGQITVPAQASDLVAFLEPMVHQVVVPRPGHLFHPKVWVLRFVADEPQAPSVPRLVCLTRNHTGDASWDVALRHDGWTMSRSSQDNDPLAALVTSLPSMTAAGQTLPSARREAVDELADWIRYAGWEWPDGVSAGAFHALGIGPASTRPDFGGRKRVVIAPFCNDDGLSIVAPVGCTDVTLVAGPADLDRLSPDSLARVRACVVSAAAGLDPEAEDDESERAPDGGDRLVRGGLHAKLTVLERARQAIVFVGSANATGAAYEGHVELLVEMRGSPAKLGVGAVLDVDAGLGGILEHYDTVGGDPIGAAETALRVLQQFVRRAAALGWVVTVDGAPDRWTLEVATMQTVPDDDVRLAVEVLSRPGRSLDAVAGATSHGCFDEVPTADVSPFLVLRATVEDESAGSLTWATVVRAELRTDPAGRLDEILARQIDTPEKLLRFLVLVLGLGRLDLASLGGDAGESAAGWTFGGSSSTGLFEALVRALAEQPRRFDDVSRLVERLLCTERGREVLPDGFEALWTVVCEARDRIEANPSLIARTGR